MSFRKLHGLFAAHKPADLSCYHLIGTLKTNLLKDLNASSKLYLPKLVKVSAAGKDTDDKQLWKVEEKEDLRYHPLVAGPYFNMLNIQIVSGGLDTKSSGVLVLSVGKASKYISAYQKALLPRQYHIDIQLGIATDNYEPGGKVILKSTYHHISREKFDRVVAGLTKASKQYNTNYSGLDMQSQEAYDLAVAGKLETVTLFNQPSILSARCLNFNPPHIKLEMECLNEDSEFLRETVDFLGRSLRSSAVAFRINRIKDGPFTSNNSLLRRQWTLFNVAQSLQESKEIIKPFIKNNKTVLDNLHEEEIATT
ncbi:mitochondrial mRNA pseudouridine synthase Trub2-like isoform X2 [Anneissia japonica]|nr:mitochondrial mRNA pseudouridine synthase Trub2-like isoform X2 [Anneissia japonica]